MFPESPKSKSSQEKLFNSSREKLSQLESDVAKPWKVVYLRETADKKYKIYRYKLVAWWTKWWIKDKYVSQIWPWVEWTQFVDSVWNVLNKDRFWAWEIVYIKVPKEKKVDNKQANNKKANNKEVKDQKESKNSSWEFLHLNDYVDGSNRGWRIFSYKFYSWWTYDSVASKYIEKMYSSTDLPDMYLLPGRNFCDKNWKTLSASEIKWKKFTKWDIVYIKVPNTHVVDKVPSISYNEIMNLSLRDLANILNSYKQFTGSDISPHKWSLIEHADWAWKYIMINWKKLYIQYDDSFMKYKIAKTCIVLHETEGYIDCVSLWRYDWKKDFNWVEVIRHWKNGIEYRKWKLDL